MYLDSIRQTIATIKSNLTGESNVKEEALIASLSASLEANANLTRVIEQTLGNKEYSRYLIRDTKESLSLIEKLTKSDPGEIVALNDDEWKASKELRKL